MGDVINLRLARKRFARKAAEDKAAENRAHHGLSKGEKQRQRDEAERQARHIDGARRDTPQDEGEN